MSNWPIKFNDFLESKGYVVRHVDANQLNVYAPTSKGEEYIDYARTIEEAIEIAREHYEVQLEVVPNQTAALIGEIEHLCEALKGRDLSHATVKESIKSLVENEAFRQLWSLASGINSDSP